MKSQYLIYVKEGKKDAVNIFHPVQTKVQFPLSRKKKGSGQK